MSRRAQENIVCIVLLCVFAGVIWLCQDFGPRARMIPLPLAIFGLVLTAVQLAWQNLGSTDELQMEMIAVPEQGQGVAQPAGAAEAPRRATWRDEARAFGIVGALLALVLLLGPMPAVFLFTAAYFAVTRHCSLRMAVIYTAVFTAATYLLFFVALEIQPYNGVLAPLFGQ